ncbi:MAG: NAD(P)/FAD-dependent oxidoreductase [Candidatus Competibacteraceae bacterium]|nr:NAD(P)/FAD-dependent oxidoreductase [Candidatus Competibacteraceae bacterium]
MTCTLNQTKPRLVLVGNGMAGMRALEELLKRAPNRYAITVFGAEPHGNYNRIQLSPLLAGERTLDEIILHQPAWYDQHGIELHTGSPVVAIDRTRRRVWNAAGVSVQYEELLLATGSVPVMLPLPGSGLPGVLSFRTINDVSAMLAASFAQRRRAVVIGGGLLGLEAAYGLHKQGMAVTVVHLQPHLLERQLDEPAACLLADHLRTLGIELALGAQTEALLGQDQVNAVQLNDGRVLPTDLVVMAVGVRPDIELARQSGLQCERGIIVNDALQTSDPRIHAVGECVQHRGQCYGLVAPLWDQAQVFAERLAGKTDAQFTGAIPATTLKVTGIDVFSAGDFQAHSADETSITETLVLRDPAAGIYKKLVLRTESDGAIRLVGVVLIGDARASGWYLNLLKDGTDVAAWRDELMFGPLEQAA